MRAKALIAAMILLAGCATAPTSAPTLVGAWRLERYVDTPDGEAPIMAFGEHPVGLFVFTADGHAAISMMANPPRTDAPPDPDPDACQPAWYCSYFGTYTVDWSRSEWNVHVEGGNIPSFIGTDQTRGFRLDGDRIVIAGAYEDENGRSVRYERVLTRAD